MLRTIDERDDRQRALRERKLETWDEDFLTLKDIAGILKVHPGTARRLFRREPGVEVWRTPGRHRPIVRVPRSVFERVLRRSAIPEPGRAN